MLFAPNIPLLAHERVTLSISPTNFGTVTAGSSKSFQMSCNNSVGDLNWSVSSGSLPSGLSLNSNTGLIDGTCNQVGSYDFTISAIDSFGDSGSETYSGTISVTSGSQNYTTPGTFSFIVPHFNTLIVEMWSGGAGGTGGGSYPGIGGTGGTSSISQLNLTATGGTGGQHPGGSSSPGGSGGTASGGNYQNVNGNNGGASVTNGISSNGGTGAGAPAGSGNVSAQTTGSSPGGGGGGGNGYTSSGYAGGGGGGSGAFVRSDYSSDSIFNWTLTIIVGVAGYAGGAGGSGGAGGAGAPGRIQISWS